MASSKNNFILRMVVTVYFVLKKYLKKIHRAIGYRIYLSVQEPISTKLAPKPNLDNPISEIVKRLLGLHYFM
jgi:hypothetical protein